MKSKTKNFINKKDLNLTSFNPKIPEEKRKQFVTISFESEFKRKDHCKPSGRRQNKRIRIYKNNNDKCCPVNVNCI
jgi:hypothetical protein